MMCFTIIFILINFTNSLYITKLIINSFHRDNIKLINRKYDIYMNDNFIMKIIMKIIMNIIMKIIMNIIMKINHIMDI